jgi:hypothetical protein
MTMTSASDTLLDHAGSEQSVDERFELFGFTRVTRTTRDANAQKD